MGCPGKHLKPEDPAWWGAVPTTATGPGDRSVSRAPGQAAPSAAQMLLV